jgi:hypothetical protein
MKYIEPKFDSALLDATSEDKLDYFQRKLLGHPHLEQAYNLALDSIEFAAKGEIVAIVGPTGVGTTQLGKKLWRKFRDVATTVDEDGRVLPLVPAIGLEAPNQADRIDADYWKRLLAEIMRRGGDLLIDRKIYVPPSEFILTHPIPYADPLKRGIDTLIRATVSMLEQRQTKLLLINQADRLFPESDPAGCARSQQILMDLSAQTNTRFVLIGGYQLVRASCARNNWLRRQHTVHFRRYDRNNKQEYGYFVRSLTNLLACMPTEQRLENLSEAGAMQLYISSVGCIGTLKKTLLLAFQHALRTGEAMTESFILPFATHNVVALEIAKEARMGEHLLMDVTQSEVERVLDAGMPSEVDGAAVPANKPRPKSPAGGQGFYGRRRIGERRSSRDPVGGRDVKNNG